MCLYNIVIPYYDMLVALENGNGVERPIEGRTARIGGLTGMPKTGIR
ncbi:MAG: hypothetical protein MI740_05765 [Halanaerobiales bacterium]|nr:hypothetical protein [Halanaerobiales bacterium]